MPMTRVDLCYLGKDEWQTLRAIEYIDWPKRCKLTVPADYRFDLASIPPARVVADSTVRTVDPRTAVTRLLV